MIELVVFDLAGTTVHDGDAVSACFRGALGSVGVSRERTALVMGLPKPVAIRQLLHEAGRSPTEDEVEAIHADFIRRMNEYYASSPEVREVPGAAAAFAALRRAGVKVAVNTGFYRAVMDVLLGRLGWSAPGVLDAAISSDEVARGRPAPDMIRELMRRCGVAEAGRVAKVGDTWADLEEGQAAGCAVNIGVTSGAFTAEQLRQRPHTHIFGSVAEVPAVVLRGGG